MIGDQDESQGAFIRDDLPLLDEGSNGGISFEEAGFEYGVDYGTFPLPVNEGGESMAVPRGLSVASDTENKCEAGLVLRYMSEPEQVIPRFTELLSSPIRSYNLMESEELAERLAYFTDEIKEEFQTIERQIPPGTTTLEVGTILKELLDELTVTGTDEPAEELAARYLDEMLALED
jgi:ABC-type glycerol-3-phosphate transport system substrate-binding protein